VKSHGRGLNFNDDDDDAKSPALQKSAPSPTVSATTSALDREAEREATEMLLRSAKKLTTPKKVLQSPLRSPTPVQMDRVVPGVPMSVLADSTATQSFVVRNNQESVDNVVCDEEVTSQPSLPPGFDASTMLDEYSREDDVAAPVTFADDIIDHIDVFAQMMSKVISDTIEEISASLAAKPVISDTIEEMGASLAVNQRQDVKEPTTPLRRSSRHKSIAANNGEVASDPVTPSRKSSRSKDPVTPSRRSKRVASRGKK